MISFSELLLIVIVAFVILTPKQLSELMYTVGRYLRKWQGIKETVRGECSDILQQAQLQENVVKAEQADRCYLNRSGPSAE